MFFYTRRLQDASIEVKLNKSYILKPDHDLFGFVEVFVPLLQNKNQIHKFPKEFHIHLYSSLEMRLDQQEEAHCSICLEPLLYRKFMEEELYESSSKDGYSLKCLHAFHQDCLEDYINSSRWFKCPDCQAMNGLMYGSMPEGIMTTTVKEKLICQSFPPGAILIRYEMFAGRLGEIEYDEAKFEAYLPHNEQGRKVAKMLQEAFRRKLTFSLTQDKKGKLQVEWSGIPHKTALRKSKESPNGYPDAQYLAEAELYLNKLGISS